MAVDDIVVHPREQDLVVATHGRSLYILDDVAPLAQLTAEVVARDAHLFAPRPALGAHLLPGFADWAGTTGIYRGANPPEGAILTYWIKEDTGEPVKIAVEGPGRAAGREPDRLRARRPQPRQLGPDAEQGRAHRIRRRRQEARRAAGEYKVTLTYGKAKSEQRLKVEVAPGVETR